MALGSHSSTASSYAARRQVTTLLSLADSRLPTGGHVHSGGVEEAIASGFVRDIDTLEAFLRRRIRTSGATAASIAGAVVLGSLDTDAADAECDARTPSPAVRAASRAQGRGLLRLAKSAWPHHDWLSIGRRPHLAVAAGHVGLAADLSVADTAAVQVYITMTGSAIAAQRLLALDPAEVASCTIRLGDFCDEVADAACASLPVLMELSDPLLDMFAEAHAVRDRPLFVS
ncbi:urease accessory protein UreF [Rhodococcus fascians]|uniref:urease accessory protein UreF n=1 Tax=Rhodococcoides fascians TaxID=1828 RepID=UPI001960DBBB|nr:urease accessory UreF family protein [Rhodococcus fascians]MBM7244509.1 urease accessory protein UreF [Rhodococcus fascians]MBY3807968.1 urease accessory protein UreF [Rhodococcus fascians]MBY3839515.1 urease accessory protein UreF [Rhodococcus fascians]MBY3848259.1 urease accessory protein UreF [Rhodococcus fascians]MBY3851430.1 urease accessory protein UreF [Rhodococcus fascians]